METFLSEGVQPAIDNRMTPANEASDAFGRLRNLAAIDHSHHSARMLAESLSKCLEQNDHEPASLRTSIW
jgi:hypothetical protein